MHHNRLDVNTVKLWKQTKNCTNIFEGPIKILGTEVFRDGQKLEAQNFFFTPDWTLSNPHPGLPPCRGGGAYAPMTQMICNLKERS